MNSRRGAPLPDNLKGVMRELVNAYGKSSMYPPGHQFAREAAEKLTAELAAALEIRGSITFGFTPQGPLLDGTAIDPLGKPFKQLAGRIHRRGVGTIHFAPGMSTEEVAEVVRLLASGDPDDEVGRDGLRLAHIRVDPLIYDVLAFGDASLDLELDESFWAQLIEAATGHRAIAGQSGPTAAQIAAAINERAPQSVENARRIYEALAAFSSALVARKDQNIAGARRRFTEVLAAVSRPAATAVMGSVPSKASRRRFLRETIESVPATLILQILDSVAEADGDPMSDHLRWLLGKLAGQELGERSDSEGDFATQVMSLMEQWDDAEEPAYQGSDSRLVAENARLVMLGLELDLASPAIIQSAIDWAADGHLADLVQVLDQPGGSSSVRDTISAQVFDRGLLERLLAEPAPDWTLIGRVVQYAGIDAVAPLLNALELAENRTLRRRMMDQLVAIGQPAEDGLVGRLHGASWYLARNILGVLSQLPSLTHVDAVLPMLEHTDQRVRLEALKVLLKGEGTRNRAVCEALESDDEAMIRTAMAALAGKCPPQVVAPLLSVLSNEDDDMVMHAIKLISASDNPLIVGPLLELVRERRGLFRRWRLAPRTPVMLSALEVLFHKWPNHRPVVLLMHLAKRSNDPDVHRVIGGHG